LCNATFNSFIFCLRRNSLSAGVAWAARREDAVADSGLGSDSFFIGAAAASPAGVVAGGAFGVPFTGIARSSLR